MEALPAPVLDRLREITSPTVANAIEVFNVLTRSQGFMRPEIRCVFPNLGVMVGYAVTVKIRAASPGAEGPPFTPACIGKRFSKCLPRAWWWWKTWTIRLAWVPSGER